MTRIEPTEKRKLEPTLDARPRLWLARALRESMRLAQRSPRARSQFWMDDDACDELDIAPYDSARFLPRFREIGAIIATLERSEAAGSSSAAPFKIARFVGDLLELSVVERDVLAFAMLSDHDALFGNTLDDHCRTLARFARVAGPVIGVSADAFLFALDPRGTLARCKLVSTDELRINQMLTLHPGLKELLRKPPRTREDAMRAFVETGKKSALALADVSHVARDVETAVALVSGAVADRVRGVNVLLWGPPGTGKTETARLIAAHARVELGEVPVAGRGHEKLGAARLGSYQFCQRLLARAPRGAVLFDELEDVLPRSAFAALWGVAESRDDKGLFVRMLEENAIPTIWTTNHVDHVDPALLRRFDLVLEMKIPPERLRRRAVDQHLEGLGVSEAARKALAADERLAPAVVARAARVAQIARVADPARVVARVIDNSLKVVAGPKRVPFASTPFAYDLAFTNASVDLARLTKMIASGRAARLCLYGPPGSGKTAFVKHAAERANQRVIVKRMSDILSCWVGETEKNIAAMFEEARDEEAVLLLDEADGLLRSRERADRSWELTQTNELLVQMEAFDGVFACATNLVDALDPAAFRRFDVKVRFDPLTRAQRRALFGVLALAVGVSAPTDDLGRLDRIDGLCAGDFAAAARRASLLLDDGAGVGELLALLEQERSFIKSAPRVGFVQ